MSSEFEEPLVITDKRRLDPETGLPRIVESPTDDPDPQHPDAGETGKSREDELLADLQRVTAEYANYRKRVDRDRLAMVEESTARLLEAMLPLLDSIELARQHGDLEGAFKGVGEGLEQLADRHGLERYGAKGEPFDPAVHNALMQVGPDDTVEVPTVADLLQPGWRLRSGRILRPAGVAVAEPAGTE